MNAVDLLLLLLLAAAVLWAVRRCVKNARSGGCSGCPQRCRCEGKGRNCGGKSAGDF